MDIGEDLRKIFLAGVGAVAETAERSKDMIDELVKKGELTLEQGRTLNEELKRNVKDRVREHVTVTVSKAAPADVQGVKDAVENMGAEELEQVKAKIAEVEGKRAAQSADGQENAGK
jgi:polyhydroxyalkanoate synthesis regulator phasin